MRDAAASRGGDPEKRARNTSFSPFLRGETLENFCEDFLIFRARDERRSLRSRIGEANCREQRGTGDESGEATGILVDFHGFSPMAVDNI